MFQRLRVWPYRVRLPGGLGFGSISFKSCATLSKCISFSEPHLEMRIVGFPSDRCVGELNDSGDDKSEHVMNRHMSRALC